jgi:hypothetical protein
LDIVKHVGGGKRGSVICGIIGQKNLHIVQTIVIVKKVIKKKHLMIGLKEVKV